MISLDKLYSKYILFAIFFISALLRNNLFRAIYGIDSILYGMGLLLFITQAKKINLKKLFTTIILFAFLAINMFRGINNFDVLPSYFNFIGGSFIICLLCLVVEMPKKQYSNMLKAYIYGTIFACLILIVYYMIPTLNPYDTDSDIRYSVAGTDPNEFSILINIALAMVLFTNLFKSTKRILFTILYLFAILSTGSRTGFICLCILILLTLFISNGSKIKRVISILTICIIGWFIITSYISDGAAERLLSIGKNREDLGDEDGLSGRSFIWADAYRIWNEASVTEKIVGYGINTFAKMSIFHLEPHNVFIKVIIECGCIGFFILLIILYKCFRYGWGFYNKNLFFAIYIIFLMSFTTLSWIYNPTTALIFCILFSYNTKCLFENE